MLRCECGGSLELTYQNYGEESMFERYECVSCGKEGSYGVYDGNNTTSGCVSIV